MPKKHWPPPGYPIVEGDHSITSDWLIYLPTNFAHRIKEGDLVFWCPGLTIWVAVWNNDKNESQADRLTSIKATASARRFAERESVNQTLTRYSYRLREEGEDSSIESSTFQLS